jgi:multidrug efflux pump subunit AcrA (membrane-fusion protein)
MGRKIEGRRAGPRVRAAAIALLAGAVGAGAMLLTGGVRAGSEGSPVATDRPAASAPRETTPEVTVERVTARALRPAIRVTGTLKSEEVVALSTKANGLVREVRVKEGDRVRKGELLVRIDDGELGAQRERALAVVRVQEAKLQQARTSRGIKNASARSEYRQAQQALAAARTRLSQAEALAKIAATEVESGVATARAQLQAARERLKVLQDGARRQERAAAELAVARAETQVNKLKANLQRREQLLRDGAIAREDVENHHRDYEAALVELRSAREQADLVSEGPRSEEVRVAEEEVRRAEAALWNAEANRARRGISDEDAEAARTEVRRAEARLEASRAGLAQRAWNDDEIAAAAAEVAKARADARYYAELIAQTRVYSPVDGVVSRRTLHVGETVGSGPSASPGSGALLTLVATARVYLEATAPEGALSYLKPGLPAAVTLDARPGRTFSGSVREIIPVAEGATRSVRLRIALPPSDGLATVVGGFARATLQGESREEVLTVPRAAVQSDEGARGVYVLEGISRASWRPLRLGETSGDRIEVLGGLRAGEPVIVAGASLLTDGQKVRLAGRDTAGGASPRLPDAREER